MLRALAAPCTVRSMQQVCLANFSANVHLIDTNGRFTTLQVVMNWVAAILTLADHLAAHPTASHAAMDAEQHQQPLPKGATHKMDLAKYSCYSTCCTCLLIFVPLD